MIKKLKAFFKSIANAWEEYCKTESDRYNNGYYDRSDRIKMNCCYCKTDWEIKNYGVSYRCVYPEFVSEPVIRLTDNKPTFFCSSLEEAEKLRARIDPIFKTEKPKVNHTERLMSNVYGMEIEPKGIDSLLPLVGVDTATIGWNDNPVDPYSDLRDGMDLMEGIRPIYSEREKVIDKIMEGLKGDEVDRIVDSFSEKDSKVYAKVVKQFQDGQVIYIKGHNHYFTPEGYEKYKDYLEVLF